MAWIESHQELGRHPKTKKLARLTGIALPAAIGHLFYLWWWAMDYAQDGDLTRYAVEEIADAALWNKDARKLIDALVEAGFLDRDGDNLGIHDWHKYAGKRLEQLARDRDRKRKSDTVPRSLPGGQPEGDNLPAEGPESGKPDKVDLVAERGFSPAAEARVREWLKYKTERREGYKPTGLKSLLTEIENNIKKHGEPPVIELISQCMSSNWKGIIWDRLGSGKQSGAANGTSSTRDYDEKF